MNVTVALILGTYLLMWWGPEIAYEVKKYAAYRRAVA